LFENYEKAVFSVIFGGKSVRKTQVLFKFGSKLRKVASCVEKSRNNSVFVHFRIKGVKFCLKTMKKLFLSFLVEKASNKVGFYKM